jgi:hypothetical protein
LLLNCLWHEEVDESLEWFEDFEDVDEPEQLEQIDSVDLLASHYGRHCGGHVKQEVRPEVGIGSGFQSARFVVHREEVEHNLDTPRDVHEPLQPQKVLLGGRAKLMEHHDKGRDDQCAPRHELHLRVLYLRESTLWINQIPSKATVLIFLVIQKVLSLLIRVQEH